MPWMTFRTAVSVGDSTVRVADPVGSGGVGGQQNSRSTPRLHLWGLAAGTPYRRRGE